MEVQKEESFTCLESVYACGGGSAQQGFLEMGWLLLF